MIRQLLLTARTVVHLRPRQVAARLLRSARRAVGGPALRHPPHAPTLRPTVLRLAGRWAERFDTPAFAPLVERARTLRDGTFQAVGETLPVEEIDWTARTRSHLFSYHLHYFEDTPGLAALARRGDVSAETRILALWEAWLEACETGRGDGWDPYPVASRIPNWVEAVVLLTDRPGADTSLPPLLRDRVLSSLWTQADRLARTLEHDLAGNHLLRNRTALVWASAALDPPPRDLDRMVDALDRELRRQVLDDGMHEERTPGYQAVALHDLLRVIELLRAVGEPVPAGLEERTRRMSRALRFFVRTDGALHPFGDTTPRGRPTPAILDRLARDVLGARSPWTGTSTGTEGPWHLEDAGYAGVRGGRLELVLDCGPFGAKHQPGHGHCDGLSFVLSVGATPVVVDPGIAGYADDPHRDWARSTAAHSTVQVDEREQTEIWGTFRAARRARPGPAGVTAGEGRTILFGAMTPFHARGVVHERKVLMREGEGEVAVDELEIRDRIRGARNRRLDTRLHFHPGTVVDELGALHWRVTSGNVILDLEVHGVDGCRWETGRVFPGWGRVEEAPVLRGWIDDCPEASTTLGFRLRIHR